MKEEKMEPAGPGPLAQEIFEYTFVQSDRVQLLDLPIGAKILTFQYQGKQPRIWAEVNPNAEKQTRRFLIVGTGWELPPDRKYIGTAQDGFYVWHLYEQAPTEPPPSNPNSTAPGRDQ